MTDTDRTPWRTDSILPAPPAGAIPVLHDREYRVESFLLDNGNLLIQGAVRDHAPILVSPAGDLSTTVRERENAMRKLTRAMLSPDIASAVSLAF